MADVKWIKITTDVFDDEKILLIESLPDGYAIITVWFKLLCLAGKQNNGGVFMLGQAAYTEKMLATIFRMKKSTVSVALQTFEKFGMIEMVDGVITIPNWNKHQALDAYEKKKERDRVYQQERRAAQKALISGTAERSSDASFEKSSDTSPDCKQTQSSYVAVSDKEEDKERDKDIEKDIEKENDTCKQVVDLYHSICTSYPSVKALSEVRKREIKARLNTYSLDDLKAVFEKAEASSFLKGRNNRNWIANFDWLIRDENMAKVLDGNYDRPEKENKKPGFNDIMHTQYDYDSLERDLLSNGSTGSNFAK